VLELNNALWKTNYFHMKNGKTALIHAVINGNALMARVLLELGSDDANISDNVRSQ
jgi:ankyrin repeat protein